MVSHQPLSCAYGKAEKAAITGFYPERKNKTMMTETQAEATKRQKLMIVDGHAMIHRAFHAVPEDLATSKGEVVNATFGFTSILIKELADIKPEYVAVAFDRPRPTFRHVEYPAYKAQRPSLPDIMRPQFGRIREIVESLGIPIKEKDGYEADDVIGTLSVQATQSGVDTIILTGDMDTLQLVNEHVRVKTANRGIADVSDYGIPEVVERYGLPPEKLPDFKGLVGDTSDNIPGVPGIGPKTATKLLTEYGDLEGVLAHVDELSPKEQRLLKEQSAQALQSKHLATIVLDVPVQLDLEASRAGQVRREQAVALFRDLEFRTLVDKIPGVAGAGSTPANPQNGKAEENNTLFIDGKESMQTRTTIIDDVEALQELVQRMRRAGAFALDTETTSDDPWHADLVGISFAMLPGEAYYIPVGHIQTVDGQEAGKQLPLAFVLAQLKPVLEDANARKYCHNAKYDLLMFLRNGITVKGLAFDTMVGAYLTDPGRRGLGLKDQVFQRLGHVMTPITELIGTGSKAISIAKVPIQLAADYAGADADMTLRLVASISEDLRRYQLLDLFDNIEMPLLPVLMQMELYGVALDGDFLRELDRRFPEQISALH